MSDFELLAKELVKFRDERNWKQFHNTKDLALALSIEASELNELFLWKTTEQAEEVDKDRLREELADIFAYAIMLSYKHGFDITEIVLDKIKKNGDKYPVDKSKNNAAKYTEL
ncbi:MAG: nucleotide pyrophosphohydrolase [Bacteroidales bacterium]|nr:nucleotide pyrophosphohydrolase [Bacteroidales bacterium]